MRNDTFKSLPYDKAEEYRLEDGDILFARSGATVGKTFQFKNYNGDACFAGYLIKAKPDENKVLSDFLYYFTKSNSYENWKNNIFIQATIQNIGADKYQLLDVSVPPLPEQKQIADYLDRKTKQIATLIEKKQKLIELLKEQRTAIINQAVTKGLDPNVPMKDSGIEWLGEIPEHWSLEKIKFNNTVNDDVLSESTGENYEIEYIDIGSVNAENGIEKTEPMLFGEAPSRARRRVQEGDIIVSMSGHI